MTRLLRRPAADLAADLAVTLGVSLVVLGPLLFGRGLWLIGDMVFVPRQPWKDAWLGLDGTFPRAVPMDAVTSVLTHVLPGEVVQRAMLLGGFVVGGTGMGRLLRPFAWYARAAGIVLLLWNPWVYERLLIGQWPSLLGCFLLPWVVLAARRLRRSPRRGWAPAALVLVASAACAPSSGLTAVAVLAVLALRRDRATWAVVVLTGMVANLPWLLPALLARAEVASGSAGESFAVFAAHGESSAGLWPSLLSLGGIWKTAIVPGERTSALIVLLACLLSVASLLGARLAARRQPAGEVARLAWLAAGALLVAGVPALGPGADLLDRLSEHLPGLLILRDSHRYLAPAVLVLAVGLAGAVTWCRRQVAPGREAMWSMAGLLAVAPVALLPSLAWGAAGDLHTSRYPDAWHDAADAVAARPGTTVVLPWAGSYRRFGWAHDLAVLDPAPRLLPGDVIVDDRVLVTDDGRARVLPSEDPRVAAVAAALAHTDPVEVAQSLRALGVRWVLVEEPVTTAPPGGGLTPPPGRTVVDGDGLRLLDLGAPAPSEAPPDRSVGQDYRTDYPWLVWSGDLCAFVLLAAGSAWILKERVTDVTA